MNITFKQGIIKYPTTGNLQSFLQKNNSGVNLTLDNGSLLVNFAHGDSNYIFEEFLTLNNAWVGDFDQGSDYWLYWDINTLTGVRTFGHTSIPLLLSSSKPTNPIEGQHWFDLTNSKMFVYETTIWRNVIRVFAAQYDGITFSSMGVGVGVYEFAGSQVGISNVNVLAGKILFNDLDKPIHKLNKEFLTTESVFNVNGSNVDTIRLESSYRIAKALETLPKYHIVSYVADGEILLARYSDVKSIIGIVTEDVNINETVNVILDGVVSNPSWDFSEYTVGDPLWVNTNGGMVYSDPHLTDNITNPKQFSPIAKILSKNSILFKPTYQTDVTVSLDLTPATSNASGVVLLSGTPTNPLQPVVVVDNDIRLSDDRTPLQHTHDSVSIEYASNVGIVANNVSDALDEISSSVENVDSDNTTTVELNNIISVKQFDDGGVNDVKFWQGLEPSDLTISYASVSHSHIASGISYTPYTSTGDWGVLTDITDKQITSTNTQYALNELLDKKALKQQVYDTILFAPDATALEGMVVYAKDDKRLYYSNGVIWVKLANAI